MKRLFILMTVIISLTVCTFAQTKNGKKNSGELSSEEILINLEKQTWELVKRKDMKAFAALVADDFYGIYPNMENVTKPMLVQFLGAVDLKSYELTDFRTTMFSKDAAVVTYKASVRAMDNGKEFATRVNLVSGWAKRGGKWLGVFYQETLLKDEN